MSVYDSLHSAHNKAVELYGKHRRGKQESIDDELKRFKGTPSPQDIRKATVIGSMKWSQGVIAKDIVDDQKFAERQALLHGTVLTSETLLTVSGQLQEINENLNRLADATTELLFEYIKAHNGQS